MHTVHKSGSGCVDASLWNLGKAAASDVCQSASLHAFGGKSMLWEKCKLKCKYSQY